MKNLIVLLFFVTILNANNISNNLDIKGYGSFGATYNFSDNVKYKSDSLSKAVDDGVHYNQLSDIGIQAKYSFNNELSLFYQIYYKDESNSNFNTEYLNLRYQFNQNDSIKIGRTRLPLYMYSDVLHISPSYLWTKLPTSFYTFFVSNYNGIEYSKQFIDGDFIFSLDLMYGNSPKEKNLKFGSTSIDAYSNNIKGAVFNANKDNFTLRLSYFNTDNSLETPLLENDFKSATNILTNIDFALKKDLQSKYSLKEKNIDIYGLGFEYGDDFLITGEYHYSNMKKNVLISKAYSYYLSLAYNIKNFTPYIMYSKRIQPKYDTSSDEAKLDYYANALSSVNATASNYLSQTSNSLSDLVNLANLSHKSLSTGFRYQINNNLSIKMQYERVFLNNDKKGIYSSKDGNFDDIDTLNLALSFMF